jgi:hypothetical protein
MFWALMFPRVSTTFIPSFYPLSDPRFPRVVVRLLPLLISFTAAGPSFGPSDIPWVLLYHQVANVTFCCQLESY